MGRHMNKQVGLLRAALGWIYNRTRLFPLLTDGAAWALGLSLGALLSMNFHAGGLMWEILYLSIVAIGVHVAIGCANGLYRRRWRVTSYREVRAVMLAWAGATVVVVLLNHLLRRTGSDFPSSGVISGSMASALLMGVTRGVWRSVWESSRRPTPEGAKRTVIFGAGEGGAQMVRAMLGDPDSAYYPVALLDDDPRKSCRVIERVRVEGTRHDLAAVASRREADTLLIAVTNADGALVSELTTAARAAELDVRVLPTSSDLVSLMTLADVRPPTVDDLLGRDPVEIDLESVSHYIRGKRVLVTGAGGSIGSELSRQVNGFDPSHLYFLDRDESALHALQLSIEGRALLDSDNLLVADIRDRDRVFELFERCRPQVVFHTAALKHLSLLESHPSEAVKTNVVGTANLLEAAEKFDVDTFVNISTDKAADPTSALGASKMAAECLTALVGDRTGRRYVSVRFGNVLGSRGSVLPTFLDQLEHGLPLTVTDPEATRFFMTIPEAVRLVVQAGAIGESGEVMVLDMGEPVRILDLANQLIALLSPATRVVFTGLRPGEKRHEVVVASDEIGCVRAHPRITHVRPAPADPALAMDAVGPDAVQLTRELLAGSSFGRAESDRPRREGALT